MPPERHAAPSRDTQPARRAASSRPAGPLAAASLVAVALLAGCSGADAPEARLLDSGPDSGYRESGPEPWVLVLADQAAWDAFWREHRSNRAAEPEPPAAPGVDFTADAVIAVVAGVKPTGGYAVAADVTLPGAGKAAEVDVEVQRPGSGCFVTQAQTAPYELQLVPRDALDVTAPPRVTVRETVHDC